MNYEVPFNNYYFGGECEDSLNLSGSAFLFPEQPALSHMASLDIFNRREEDLSETLWVTSYSTPLQAYEQQVESSSLSQESLPMEVSES
jgi:hypothetical protein